MGTLDLNRSISINQLSTIPALAELELTRFEFTAQSSPFNLLCKACPQLMGQVTHVSLRVTSDLRPNFLAHFPRLERLVISHLFGDEGRLLGIWDDLYGQLEKGAAGPCFTTLVFRSYVRDDLSITWSLHPIGDTARRLGIKVSLEENEDQRG